MTRVLVTGAAGNVGGHVVRELRARGASVRAFVRDPGRATERFGPDVEPAVGDLDDPATVRRAMRGVDAVFVTTANGPRQVAQECTVVDAAAAAWVRRIVKLSAIGAEPGSPAPFADAHGRIEQHLAASAVPSVVLRSGFFMSNLLADAAMIRATGRLVAPAAGARIAMVDPRDVASVAATVLLGDRHDGRTYRLTGPVAVTYADLAASLSNVTGRPVTFVPVPDDVARAGMLGAGLPEWLADALVALYGRLRAGVAAEVTADVQRLTGRAPRTFADFARDHAAAFAAPAFTP